MNFKTNLINPYKMFNQQFKISDEPFTLDSFSSNHLPELKSFSEGLGSISGLLKSSETSALTQQDNPYEMAMNIMETKQQVEQKITVANAFIGALNRVLAILGQ